MAQAGGQRSFQNDDQLNRPWIATAARRLRHRYGITPEDVDVLFIQDPTSLWVLQMVEGYGFCGRGEARDFIQDGRIGIECPAVEHQRQPVGRELHVGLAAPV